MNHISKRQLLTICFCLHSPGNCRVFFSTEGKAMAEMLIDLSQLHPKQCEKCGYPMQLIVKKNGQNTLWCIQCDHYNKNAPKSETGERERTPDDGRKNIPERIRNFVRMRAGMKCEFCGATAREKVMHISHMISIDDGHRFEIPDHILNSEENLCFLCDECNQDMGPSSAESRIVMILLAIRKRSQFTGFQNTINAIVQDANQ